MLYDSHVFLEPHDSALLIESTMQMIRVQLKCAFCFVDVYTNEASP